VDLCAVAACLRRTNPDARCNAQFPSHGQRMTVVKRIAGLVLFVIVLPLCLLAALEGIANVSLSWSEATARPEVRDYLETEPDTLLGWIGRPNVSEPNHYGPSLSLTTNARGLRQFHAGATRDSVTNVSTTLGVVCSGGQLTFGAGVADSNTFCALLQRQHAGWRTHLLAQRGYSLDQSMLRYEREGSRLPHQIHLLTASSYGIDRLTTSDLPYPKPRFRLSADTLVLTNVPVPVVRERRWWRVIRETAGRLRSVEFMKRIRPPASESTASVPEERRRIAGAIFKRLARQEAAHCGVLVVGYLPTIADHFPGPSDARREQMEELSRSAGAVFVDLTPSLRTMSLDTLDWFFITPNSLNAEGTSGNYTARGHAWVAAQLSSRLDSVAMALAAPAGVADNRAAACTPGGTR